MNVSNRSSCLDSGRWCYCYRALGVPAASQAIRDRSVPCGAFCSIG